MTGSFAVIYNFIDDFKCIVYVLKESDEELLVKKELMEIACKEHENLLQIEIFFPVNKFYEKMSLK